MIGPAGNSARFKLTPVLLKKGIGQIHPFSGLEVNKGKALAVKTVPVHSAAVFRDIDTLSQGTPFDSISLIPLAPPRTRSHKQHPQNSRQ